MIKNASWIGVPECGISSCPEFFKSFSLDEGKSVKRAALYITAAGVYEAFINGRRVGDFIFAPGCTAYKKRLQYQVYDVTDMLDPNNTLSVMVGEGWYRGRISASYGDIHSTPAALLAYLIIEYTDGENMRVYTDAAWSVRGSRVLSSDIYDGEVYDASNVYTIGEAYNVKVLDLPYDTLIPQEGEKIREHERLSPKSSFVTPKDERVIDFGQNLAGYVSFSITAHEGEVIEFTHAEVLDALGNIYRDNYRGAEAVVKYICREGEQTYAPHFAFFGFRYIKLISCPDYIKPESFTAVAVWSDMKRTGYIECGNEKVARLYENTLWSQRSNFIDVPTDCPQRDERMGWTGDAQVFAATASYNYDVLKFFKKWMRDVEAEQRENGSVPDTVPNFWNLGGSGAAWGDAAVIIPWRMYLTYGDESILSENFGLAKGWVDYITYDTKEPFLWTCEDFEKRLWGKHYGDWLALDAPAGSYKGASNDDFIASVFYYNSAKLLSEYGHVLGRDMSEYEALARRIKEKFLKTFHPVTETEHVIALYYDLTDDKAAAAVTAAALERMVREDGYKMKTGFVGTPYLLYVLSEHGYADAAYSLLLQEGYPSWLYEVNHGATTIWEHWDGINDSGSFWSADMNSYNHYAYGSVVGWIYEVAAGIRPDEKYPGFERTIIKPTPDKRLAHLSASLETRRGTVRSSWVYADDGVRYEISTPTEAEITIDGVTHVYPKGDYVFYGKG